MTKNVDDLFGTVAQHRAKTMQLEEAMIGSSGVPALRKRTSNLFRPRERGNVATLDVQSLDRTLAVDPESMVATVEGMTTYERFVDACLVHGVVPAVVPELKTITVGGAITGVGIESSSFRHGFVHETVVEMDVLCGDGLVRTCRPDGEHADLFHAIPNSYGSLGYVVRAVMRVIPAAEVALEHVRVADQSAFLDLLASSCGDSSWDFVEGVLFAPDDHVVTRARFVPGHAQVSRYHGMTPYYRTLLTKSVDRMSVRDYLWRWDADWFWCSRAFGLEQPVVRFLLKRWMLRSSAYWKILTAWRRHHLEEKIHAVRKALGLPIHLREPVIQDVEIPFEHCAEFLAFYREKIDIRPCWVCPVIPRSDAKRWTLYSMEPGRLHLNFGFWESVPTSGDLPVDHFNRLLEREVSRLGGAKSLYSSVHYPRDEFWTIHDEGSYLEVKAKYDPSGRFRDLWEKVVGRR